MSVDTVSTTQAEVASLEAQAQALRNRAYQLSYAQKERRHQLQVQINRLEGELANHTLIPQVQQTPDANTDPEVNRLCQEFNASNEAITDFARQDRDATLSERQQPEYYARRDAELADLREAAQLARLRYDAAHSAKTTQMLEAQAQRQHLAATLAAKLRQQISALSAELATL
jgi:hypothetical protein